MYVYVGCFAGNQVKYLRVYIPITNTIMGCDLKHLG